LVCCCAYDAETDKRIWNTFSEFKNERRQKEVGIIAYQFLNLLAGIDNESLDSSPQETEENLGGGDNDSEE
jgi:hypothetical protein